VYQLYNDNFLPAVKGNVKDAQPVRIPDGRNDLELWEIFQTVIDAIEPEEAVIFDITHGFRSLPFLSFLAAAYLRVVKNIRLEGVYFGNFEARDQSVTPNRTPVLDLTAFVELLDWMVGADYFVRFGDARDLARLLQAQHERIKPDPHTASKADMSDWNNSPIKTTASSLMRVSQALRVVRPAEAMHASAQILQQLPQAIPSIGALARPFIPLGQHVTESFQRIALSNHEQSNPRRVLQTERDLIGWYLERNQVFQAVALAREWLISWTMVQLGLHNQLLERDIRRRVEDALGAEVQKQSKKTAASEHENELLDLSALPSHDDVVKLFGQLGELRNDLMHAGKRKNPLPADKIEERAKSLYEQVMKLPQ
ncbi:MAG: TIGR02221 family CRISPR-associated protein, partial [Roseiflexus sp.]|nr:TIGR02221 family CRISPR-associated protein [Roseiflexus sp.]